jgi:membrane protease YdiL (CAAX protease family)
VDGVSPEDYYKAEVDMGIIDPYQSTSPVPIGTEFAQNKFQTTEEENAIIKAGTSLFDNKLWVTSFAIIFTISQIVLLLRPNIGLYFNIGVLLFLFLSAYHSYNQRKLAISLAILPTSTLVTHFLTQPTKFGGMLEFYSIVLLLAVACGAIFHGHEPVLGKPFKWHYSYLLPLMALIGAGLGALGYFVMKSQYQFSGDPRKTLIVSAVVFAIAEELLFRGLIQKLSTKLLNPVISISLVTLIYVLISMSRYSFLPAFYAGIVCVALCLVYAKSQNILLTMTLNAASKISYLLVFALMGIH